MAMLQQAAVLCTERPTPVRGGRLRLTGRDNEIEALTEVASTTSGGGSAILFVGEPGVGKTALLDVAADEAAGAGRFVLRVTGAEFEADIGYSALMQAVLPLKA